MRKWKNFITKTKKRKNKKKLKKYEKSKEQKKIYGKNCCKGFSEEQKEKRVSKKLL